MSDPHSGNLNIFTEKTDKNENHEKIFFGGQLLNTSVFFSKISHNNGECIITQLTKLLRPTKYLSYLIIHVCNSMIRN